MKPEVVSMGEVSRTGRGEQSEVKVKKGKRKEKGEGERGKEKGKREKGKAVFPKYLNWFSVLVVITVVVVILFHDI